MYKSQTKPKDEPNPNPNPFLIDDILNPGHGEKFCWHDFHVFSTAVKTFLFCVFICLLAMSLFFFSLPSFLSAVWHRYMWTNPDGVSFSEIPKKGGKKEPWSSHWPQPWLWTHHRIISQQILYSEDFVSTRVCVFPCIVSLHLLMDILCMRGGWWVSGWCVTAGAWTEREGKHVRDCANLFGFFISFSCPSVPWPDCVRVFVW